MAIVLSQPAYFKIEVETNTIVSMSINGQNIEHGKWHKTEPLMEPVCVEVEISYIRGGEVLKHTFYLDLNPGDECIFKIELYTIRPLVLVC
jgi:hypothetical protein